MPTKRLIDRVETLSESLKIFSDSIDLYIFMIDLCGSTAIKQFCLENQIPDSVWITRQQIFLARSANIVEAYGGNIIKTIGDELMSSFSVGVEPEKIIKCSIEIFQTFQGLKTYNRGRFVIRSKASIDFGTCYNGQLLDNDKIDPIGSCVDRCSRLNELAQPNEIIFSEDFKDILIQHSAKLSRYNIEEKVDTLQGFGIVNYYCLQL